MNVKIPRFSLQDNIDLIKEIIEEGLVWRNAMENFAGEECSAFLSRKFPEMKMEDMVKLAPSPGVYRMVGHMCRHGVQLRGDD